MQPRVWEGPCSLGARAAKCLYRLDATVDEAAAGRPVVQEGQAGRSGPSGLATGTENRREMNRVKRGRDREVKAVGWEGMQRSEGREVGKVGDKGAPPGDTHSWGPGGQGAGVRGSRCC